jgi:hypothetical protein
MVAVLNSSFILEATVVISHYWLHLYLTSALDGPLYASRKTTVFPLIRRLGGSQGRSGLFGGEIVLCLSIDSTPDRPALRPATIQTTYPAPCGFQELEKMFYR